VLKLSCRELEVQEASGGVLWYCGIVDADHSDAYSEFGALLVTTIRLLVDVVRILWGITASFSKD